MYRVKVCKKCGREKSITSFGSYGKNNICSTCYSRDYRKKYMDRVFNAYMAYLKTLPVEGDEI